MHFSIGKNLLFLLVFLSGFLPSFAQSDEAAIQKCYDEYITAILNDSGRVAADHVDKRTIEYYNNMLGQIKHADSLAIDSMTISDKYLVLSIRLRASKAQIDAMKNGRDLFIYAVNNGMVGKNSASSTTIDSIRVKGNLAKAVVITRGKSSGAHYRFCKEDGSWKLNLTSTLLIADKILQRQAKEGGYTETQFVLMLLETINHRKVPDSAWHAPR